MEEFPTAWHRERYIVDLEREVAGAKRRIAELSEASVTAEVLDAAKEMLKNAETELARVAPKADKAKKPAAKTQS